LDSGDAAPPITEPDPRPAWVHVELGPRSYDVCIGRAVLSSLGNAIQGLAPRSRSVAFIIDDHVPAALVAGAIAEVGAVRTTCSLHLAASEPAKSLGSLETCLRFLAAHRIERADVVVALGGGIIGDLAGLAAATYRRGVPIIQCPTTLLSMVDASVGGKTGINLASDDGSLLKNMAGSFHQPLAVIAELAALDSLSPRLFRAGLAEIIKHATLAPADSGLWELTTNFLTSTPASTHHLLAELIRRNVELKAGYVVADEREELPGSGGRALLNLGHTFGHAIETLANVSPTDDLADAPLMHGEAVALGMLAAARTAFELGTLDGDSVSKIVAVIELAGLPTRVRGLPSPTEILARMMDDKKTTGGDLRLILPFAIGDVRMVEHLSRAAVTSALRTIMR